MARWNPGARDALTALAHTLVVLATLPYYRFYEFNTLGPIQQIARYSSTSAELPRLVRSLCRWRLRKMAELQYISIACAILLGAVIGTFSWNNVNSAYWLTRACWYITLLLAVLGILLSAQQVTVLNFLGDIPESETDICVQEVVERYLPLLITGSRCLKSQPEARCRTGLPRTCRANKRMVFIWQCPIMFMSYAALLFLLGLTSLVITPLIRLQENGWTSDATVAIIYLGTGTILVAIFVFSAFWVYHYLDIDIDETLDADLSNQPANGDRHQPQIRKGASFQTSPNAQKRMDSFPFSQWRAQSTLTSPSAEETPKHVRVRRAASMD